LVGRVNKQDFCIQLLKSKDLHKQKEVFIAFMIIGFDDKKVCFTDINVITLILKKSWSLQY